MTTENTPAEEQTFAQVVNATVDAVKRGEDGKLEFPEGTDEQLQYAATAEIRHRDTQSAYTKSQQRVKSLEVENTELATGWEQNFVAAQPEGIQDELAELKATDPDAWRERVNGMETEQRTKFKEKRTEITKKAENETELDRRTRVMTEFSETLGIELTDEVLANDVPPRYMKQLEAGEVDFDTFLANVGAYLNKGKKIDSTKAPGEPNLSTIPGSSTPTPQAVSEDIHQSYKTETY